MTNGGTGEAHTIEAGSCPPPNLSMVSAWINLEGAQQIIRHARLHCCNTIRVFVLPLLRVSKNILKVLAIAAIGNAFAPTFLPNLANLDHVVVWLQVFEMRTGIIM